MKMFRLQDNVPEVYVNESRDFQLLCRLFDAVNNGVRSDINSMIRVMDTKNCINRMLQLLQTRLGFFTKHSYNDDMIRVVLSGFNEIVRWKGSKRAIEGAIYLFLRANDIEILEQKVVEIKDQEKTIEIIIPSTPLDTTLLTEILNYIIPTGYLISYSFYIHTYYQVDPPTELILSKNEMLGLRISSALSAEVANYERNVHVYTGSGATTESLSTIEDGEYLKLANSVGFMVVQPVPEGTEYDSNNRMYTGDVIDYIKEED